MIAAGTTGDGVEIRPRRLRVSASTVCGLSCPGCPNGTGHVARTLGEGYLRAGAFEGMLEANPWLREVELSSWGEPFLNPEMPSIVESAARCGVRLTADNGSTLNGVSDELLDALVRYRFRRITCSIDGASQEAYGAYRRGGDFKRVIEVVRRLNSLKAKLGSPHPRLTWQFVVFGCNEHEIPAARRLSTELGMVFRLKEAWDPQLLPVHDRKAVAAQHRRVGTYGHSLKMSSPDTAARGFCHQLWEEPQISWDGRVLGCCCNHSATFDGNAFTDGLAEAINAPQMRQARAMLVGRSEPEPGVPCSSCDVYRVMRASGQHLRRGLPRRVFRFGRFVYNELGVRRLMQSAVQSRLPGRHGG